MDLAYETAVEVVGKDHVFKGTVASGDQFIASEEYVKMLQEEYDAYACEMEGASVAVICQKMLSIHDKYCIDIYQEDKEEIVIAILVTLQHMIRDRSTSVSSGSSSSSSSSGS